MLEQCWEENSSLKYFYYKHKRLKISELGTQEVRKETKQKEGRPKEGINKDKNRT